MDSEDVIAANGEKPQTLTLDPHHPDDEVAIASDEELETPNGSEGSDDTIRHLHEEIQGLRRDRSELQRRMEEMLAEVERSDDVTKSLAARASHLEGELARTQEDLASASLVAEEAENEAGKLRSAVRSLEGERDSVKKELEERIADLEVERGRMEGEIRVLKEQVRVSEMKEEEMREKSKELEMRVDEVVVRSREAMEEEVKVRASREEELGRVISVMKEKNTDLEGDLVNQKSRREVELEKTVKELKQKNSVLESDVENSRRMKEVFIAEFGSKISLTTAAIAAASTATIAVAATTFYLRHGRQR